MTNTSATSNTLGGNSESSTLRETASDKAATVKEEAGNVKKTVGSEARRLMGQVSSEVSSQASQQQKKAAGGLRSVGDQLRTMAQSSEQSGMASDIVSGAASRVDSVASWLDERDPGSIVDEVKGFARRRPGVFLAIAAGAGIVAGRLTRALMSDRDETEGGLTTRNVGATGSHSAATMPTTTGTGTPTGATTYPAGGAHSSGVGTTTDPSGMTS